MSAPPNAICRFYHRARKRERDIYLCYLYSPFLPRRSMGGYTCALIYDKLAGGETPAPTSYRRRSLYYYSVGGVCLSSESYRAVPRAVAATSSLMGVKSVINSVPSRAGRLLAGLKMPSIEMILVYRACAARSIESSGVRNIIRDDDIQRANPSSSARTHLLRRPAPLIPIPLPVVKRARWMLARNVKYPLVKGRLLSAFGCALEFIEHTALLGALLRRNRIRAGTPTRVKRKNVSGVEKKMLDYRGIKKKRRGGIYMKMLLLQQLQRKTLETLRFGATYIEFSRTERVVNHRSFILRKHAQD